MKNSCVHQLVERQVKKNPNGIALKYGKLQLSYQELDNKANQLAHYLQDLNVQPDTSVAICLERSPLMMITVLAVLKAGAAYVPLDINYPTERLVYMLDEAKPTILLSSSNLTNITTLLEQHQTTIYLDQVSPQVSKHSNQPPLCSVKPANLAYILFTSGSTGQPKGVMMEHQPLVNLLQWHTQHRLSREGTIALQFTPLSFDVSFHEIFSAWCTGGTLIITPETIRRDPLALVDLVIFEGVQKCYMPFAALQQFAHAVMNTGRVPHQLLEVITAGEQLRITAEIAHLFDVTGARLHNHYGATECQDVTSFTLTGASRHWLTLPPIGQPFDHVKIYLLDKQKQIIKQGEIGELYVGGNCLARAYLNREELTEKSFILSPYTTKKLYRTGDLARFLPDGNLEHLGRADRQVKIRGFRVELGEIEACLMQHHLVKESVVTVHERKSGIKRLLAYVVLAQKMSQANKVLSQYLQKNLPEHMIPAAITSLEKLPLTPSGKIDRGALPLPTTPSPPKTNLPSMRPRSQFETLVIETWQTVLDNNEISVQSHFFEIGGDSLSMAKVQQILSQALGRTIAMTILFQYPTVQTLASYLSAMYGKQKAVFK